MTEDWALVQSCASRVRPIPGSILSAVGQDEAGCARRSSLWVQPAGQIPGSGCAAHQAQLRALPHPRHCAARQGVQEVSRQLEHRSEARLAGFRARNRRQEQSERQRRSVSLSFWRHCHLKWGREHSWRSIQSRQPSRPSPMRVTTNLSSGPGDGASYRVPRYHDIVALFWFLLS
ncbi:hypothetical protein MCEMSEM23_01017 [Rhabdaerophilaceae bacterium]